MKDIANWPVESPLIVFAISFTLLWISALIGDSLRKWLPSLAEEERHDFGIIQAAVLTLLGLIIGFTFSMAVSRYDLRKSYEAEETNAIGTEYVRAGLLAAPDAAEVRKLLKDYLDQRVLFYEAHDEHRISRIDAETAQLQTQLWSAVQAAAAVQPTPIVALVVSGMNDVLNSQGYSQAALRNRIPRSARLLLLTIAIGCNLLIGYGARRTNRALFLVFPLAVAVSFFLISDLDSPRGGLIYVPPQNLINLSHSLRAY